MRFQPSISASREFPEAGGLMSYGTSSTEAFWQIGIYAARILKGEKPADLPVVQSTKFDFVVNSDPPPRRWAWKSRRRMLARADEVIE